jgi:DNA-binding XRE family transcriptional regulator
MTDEITFTDLSNEVASIEADKGRLAAAQAVLVEISEGQVAHAAGLQMLRASFGLTQSDLAEKLGISQSNVAQTERRGDLLVSTLRRYIETITGGELRMLITSPNHSTMEFTLAEIETLTGT